MKPFFFLCSTLHKRSFLAFSVLLFTLAVQAQTVLTGSVADDKEALIGASVKVLHGADLVRGVITDYEGNFRVQVDPGTYDLEISYTGYQTQQIKGVVALEGKLNDIGKVVMANNVISEVVITSYKVPLIEQDRTSSGQTISSSDLRSAPASSTALISGKKNKKSAKKESKPMVATSAGNTSIDGGAPKVKGSRSQSTNYYTDGVASKSPGRTTRDSLPGDYSTEQYNPIVENPFQDAKLSNISTFSIDVDAASYSNLRRYINSGQLPPPDAVRIEEMINYFDYQYQSPAGEHPFEVNTEVAPCPWNPEHKLMMIGMQGMKMDEGQLPAANLVFLIDVSGSMSSPDKLPLVIQSLQMLTDQLRPNDRVALTVYAGAAGLVLESTPGSEKAKIKEALQRLQAGGSTAGAAGIQLAYETARKNFIPNGNNRVILCTDGDFNVGTSSEDELVKLIENERESGVYLTVLGFGTGNYQDGKMQSLADKGNGNHAYIDQLSEAKKVLVKEFGGTLFAIAKDVKLQLHFNPERISGYRLIGYENRLLATEDFNDDTKDAGELGAGHRVTALYELIPSGQALPALSKLDSALVVVQKPDKDVTLKADDLMVLQLRYKKPKGNDPSRLMEYRLNAAALDKTTESDNFKLASSVAEFGLLLRDSKYKGNATFAHARAHLREITSPDANGYRAELMQLIEQAGKLSTVK